MIVAAPQQTRSALVVRFAVSKQRCWLANRQHHVATADAELLRFERNGPEGPFHVRLRSDVIGSRSMLHCGSSRDRGQARASGDVRPT